MTRLAKPLSLILSVIMLICAFPLTVFAEDTTPPTEPTSETSTEPTTVPVTKAKPVKTKVTGIDKYINNKYDSKVSFTVKITPADPARTVKLQLYNSKKEKFKTVKTYTTKTAETAKLKITIPKKYREKTTGKWRIVISKSETGKKYVSKVFKVTTSNIDLLSLNSKAACIYCVDSEQVLYDKKKDVRRQPASTTKVMTAICVIESGKWNGTSKTVAAAQRTPAQRLYARTGDSYRNKDLMYAMLLPSANDAAVLLAWGVDGTGKEFAKRMNKTAKKIGLENTHYTNSYGLPDKTHYTTAYDLSKTVAYAGTLDKFRQVVGTSHYSFNSIKYHRHYSFGTADKMKGWKGHIGGKTGSAPKSGACFTGLYKYGGKTYAVTVLGASSKAVRWKDMAKLYRYIQRYGNDKY